MHIWRQVSKAIEDFWQDVLSPQPLTSEEKQLRIHFLLRLLPPVVPILALIFITRVIFLEIITIRTYLIFSTAIATVIAIYLTARSYRYQLTVTTLYVLGTTLIIINAATSRPPYYEISYLLILPFVAAMLLSLRETIFWITLTFSAYIGFGIILILPQSATTFSDLVQQAIVFNIFILFAGYQRNRLEKNRQQLALETSRGELLKYLLNSISHDFKTPLSIINTSSYLLKRDLSDEKQTKRIDEITQQTKHLDHMIKDIVTLSHLEYDFSDTIKLLDLKQIVLKTIRNLQLLADDKNIRINTDFVEDCPKILASYLGLLRITTNLLENALKYTEQGGEICVRLFLHDKQLLLEIEDSGIGIDEAHFQAIFEPFFRADRARSTQGSGLGLSLVKKTVEIFHGTITVRSTIDVGTCFRISFPLPGN